MADTPVKAEEVVRKLVLETVTAGSERVYNLLLKALKTLVSCNGLDILSSLQFIGRLFVAVIDSRGFIVLVAASVK